MKVLIADDDFPIRDWLAKSCKEILKKEENEIRTVGNGEIALREFEREHADIVFADVKMPAMNGLELTGKIRDMNPDVYIVILSSYDDFHYARQAFSNKVNEYILKTEITQEHMKNILERASKHVNEGKSQKHQDSFYSFDEIVNELKDDASKDEKLAILKKYDIKIPITNYFCVSAYNKKKKYESLKMIQEDKIYKLFDIKANMSEVICFAISGEVSMLYQFQKANIFMRRLAGLNPNHILCCSEIGGIPENVLYCAAAAIKGLNYRYYTDANVIFAGSIKKNIEAYSSVPNEILEQYMAIVDAKDQDDHSKIKEKILEWFALLDKYKPIDVIIIKNMCQRIYDAVKKIVKSDDVVKSSEIITRINKACKIAELKEIILDAYADKVNDSATNRNISSTIQAALNYIHNYYSEIAGLGEVADEVGLNPEYFSRLFKAEIGMNFSAYLSNYRLDKAMHLLTKTDKKLYEIADETGFASLSYFSKKFKERFKKTAFDYRK